MSLPKHSSNWNRLTAPWRPTQGVVDEIVKLCDLSDDEGFTLLLGVTPEFYDRYDFIVAVEKSPTMINAIWPGNTAHKNSVIDDWQTMTWPQQEFQHIIGDLAITMLGSEGAINDFQNKCWRWLRPGGVFAQRIMVRPERFIGTADINQQLKHPTLTWQGFRMMLLLHRACSTDDGRVALSSVRNLFDALVPDRDRLADDTGWTRQEIDTIDLYRDIDTVTCILNKKQWRDSCPVDADVAFQDTYDYDMAEHCPILCWEKPHGR